MSKGFHRLAIPLRDTTGEKCGWWILEAASRECELSLKDCEADSSELPAGWLGMAAQDNAPIRVAYRGDRLCIQLDETIGYEWCANHNDPDLRFLVSSSLEGRNWSIRQNKSGSFRVVNHLGMAGFTLESDRTIPLELSLEIVSRKLDFESEYRQMTEEIADFCQQLLLNWEAPTSLSFAADGGEESKLLLEQFIFLRNFMNSDRLSGLLEAIDRNPHTALVRERRWVPSSAVRSSDHMSSPATMLRGWSRAGEKLIPSEALDVRKEDTYDTAPNRFVKYALSSFREICSEVAEISGDGDAKVTSVGIEALEMIRSLDALLARPFFREVGVMRRLPLDNQTLQKREGYREVLQAWLLTRAAASLQWEGEREAYSGASRNVATLYEYWIFIRLHDLIGSILGMIPLSPSDMADEFITESGGRITINLKAGKHSRRSYKWTSRAGELKVDLHYERTFVHNPSPTSGGSYSRQFRPDYTLSIYPSDFTREEDASKEGKVAHLHFDAKYRAETIKGLFGDSDGNVVDISDDKTVEKSVQIYKRGDLLKMHTYNDALRHTIGSYVLYPGTTGQETTKMGKFHEIAPGVGALVMKPGNEDCLNKLRDFILDVFEHQVDGFSQYRYLSETGHRTHAKKPYSLEDDVTSYRIARTAAPCVVLWMRRNDAHVFHEHGFAYCHALDPQKNDRLNINLSIETGSEFIPVGGKSGSRVGLGWRAKVGSARLMAISELKNYISGKGLDKALQPQTSSHYILYEFEDVSPFGKLDMENMYSGIKTGSQYMAITCTWGKILESLPEKASSAGIAHQ